MFESLHFFFFLGGGVQFGIAFVPETLVEHITCVVFWGDLYGFDPMTFITHLTPPCSRKIFQTVFSNHQRVTNTNPNQCVTEGHRRLWDL